MGRKLTYKEFEKRHEENTKKGLILNRVSSTVPVGESYIIYEVIYGKFAEKRWMDLDNFDVVIPMEEVKFVKFEELLKH